MHFYSTNDPSRKPVSFEEALLKGQPDDFGLYMMARQNIPVFSPAYIGQMKHLTYSETASRVLHPYLCQEVPDKDLNDIMHDAYNEDVTPVPIQRVAGKIYIMWLTHGPTLSFKDFAARFYARILDYFLNKHGVWRRRIIVLSTSGDTGPAIADAVRGRSNVKLIIFFPESISATHRRQMSTLQDNVYAVTVKGDFDVCQALAKTIINDTGLAERVLGDREIFTSANSISLGRLLPQAVYPFYAYSKISERGEKMIASIPSGNFGDMMGTVIARQMGLPIERIICGLNENDTFLRFMKTGKYEVRRTINNPSSAMDVAHPSNMARLINFYGGHMYDERDPVTKRVIREGIIDEMPNLDDMNKDIGVASVSIIHQYLAMKVAYNQYGIILEPHGAVGWEALFRLFKESNNLPAVIYETVDPGKLHEEVEKAISEKPPVPEVLQRQANLPERIYPIESEPLQTENGPRLSNNQIEEVKKKIAMIFS